MLRLNFYGHFYLVEKRGHEKVQGFFENMPVVWRALRKSKGIIAVIGAKIGAEDCPPIAFTKGKSACALEVLAIWSDLESLYAFVYYGIHGEMRKTGRRWIREVDFPLYVLWWREDDRVPDWQEAHERYEYFLINGSSHYGFNFEKPFDEHGLQVRLNTKIIESKGEALMRECKDVSLKL